MIFQFFVSVYGGYFGAGMGILMLAALAILGHDDIHQMNGLKNLLALFINAVAAAYFVAAGMVIVGDAVVMAARRDHRGRVVGRHRAAHGTEGGPARRDRRRLRDDARVVPFWAWRPDKAGPRSPPPTSIQSPCRHARATMSRSRDMST